MTELRMHTGWENKKLGEVFTIGKERWQPNRSSEKVNYIGLENIESITGELVDFMPVDSLTIRSSKNRFTSNDILYGKLRPYLNKVHFPEFDGICSTDILVMIPKPIIRRKFLGYFLRSQYVLSKISDLTYGTRMPRMKVGDLMNLSIPLPSLQIQDKIIQKLDYIFRELEDKKKKILKLQDPIKIKKLQDSIKFQILLSLRNGSLANEGWKTYERKKLGTITHITSGGTPLRTVSEYWNGNIPWIKSGELLDSDIEDSEEHITILGLESSAAKKFPPDTILVALYGQGQTRGRTGRLVNEATTNQACCAILPESSIYARYLQYWIRGLYWELRENSSGGAQPNWNSNIIRNIEIVIPPISIQKSLVYKLDEKFKQMKSVESDIRKIIQRKEDLTKYFENISSRILTGVFLGRLVN